MNTSTPYDEIVYPGYAFSQTHPLRLAAWATMYGIKAPNPQQSRILEIACSDGGNIVNIAHTLPNATVVGIDYSERQIAMAKDASQALNLQNLQLKCMDVADLQLQSFGEFDYIIAHGLYSWVPTETQHHILRSTRELLSPNGIAYLSFNTLPGWYIHQPIRDILCYISRNEPTLNEKMEKAGQFLRQWTHFAGNPNSTYHLSVREAEKRLRENGSAYLAHEFLEEHNEQLYFDEFSERLANHALRYVSEAAPNRLRPFFQSEETQGLISDYSSDAVGGELCFDMLSGRQFRRAIICRNEIQPHSKPQQTALYNFNILSYIHPKSEIPDVLGSKEEEFSVPDGSTIYSSTPFVKAVFTLLSKKFPNSVSFSDLFASVADILEIPPQELSDYREKMGDTIWQCFLEDYCEMHAGTFPVASELSEFPVVSPVARLMLENGNLANTLLHTTINITDPIAKKVLMFCNGKTSVESIGSALESMIASDELALRDRNGNRMNNPEEIRHYAHYAATTNLQYACRVGLAEQQSSQTATQHSL